MYPHDFRLKDSDEKYLRKLRSAFAIMSEELSMSAARKKIEEVVAPDMTVRSVYNIMNDVKSLFGNVIKTNKNFDRSVLREKFIKLASRAQKQEDLETERLCYVNIMKLDGLDQHDSDAIDWETLEIPELVITSNPKALSDNLEAEDAEIDEEE